MEKLTRAMNETENEALRKRTQAIGQQIRSEEGIGEALKWIENYSNEFHTIR